MSKRNHDTKRAREASAVPIMLDEDDANELGRHAKRLGVSVDVLLTEAAAILLRDVGGEQPPASTVEYLAKHGRSVLRKRDLN